MHKQDLINRFKNRNNYIFCFEIETRNMHKIYLSSSNSIITTSDKIFLPNSSLNLKNFEMHESGVNNCIIEGFFEEGGIENSDILNEANIVIYFGNIGSQLTKFEKYYVKKLEISGPKFEIFLTSIIYKFNNKLTKNYSKNCRAKLGDKYCKVDVSLYENIECDKTFTMCCNKFKNAINFRGEPFIPTIGYFSNSDE